MTKIRDLTLDNPWGRLTAIKFVGRRNGGTYWLCVCSCEAKTEKVIRSNSLVKGTTKSCGCLNIEILNKRSFKHGDTAKTSPYQYLNKLWRDMKTRCYTDKPQYKWWYGEGITVFEPWINDYIAFRTWILTNLGHRPTTKHSLDRFPNTKGNYEPGNLRWGTQEEQNRNRSCVTLTEKAAKEIYDLKGIKLQREIAKQFNVSLDQVKSVHRKKNWKSIHN